MADVHWLDHLYVLGVILAIPAISAYQTKSTLKRIRDGGEAARVSAYGQIIVSWFACAVLLLIMWWSLGRDFGVIGFRWPREGTVLFAILGSSVFLAGLGWLLRSLTEAPDPVAALEAQLGELLVLLPKTRREEAWFYGVSLNAGLVEELIFRGFLLWYLAGFLDGFWPAVGAILLFGFAHAYQGLKQLPNILLVSTVLVVLYRYTESLLLPIVLHVAIDAVQGRCFARLRRAHGGAHP